MKYLFPKKRHFFSKEGGVTLARVCRVLPLLFSIEFQYYVKVC